MISQNWAKELFASCKMTLTDTQWEKLDIYMRVLLHCNKTMNLTAITTPEQVWEKHFLDSAILLKLVPIHAGMEVCDIGTGAGFPGMVLAILCPDAQFCLIDSVGKRLDFLDFVRTEVGLENVTMVHSRAELLGKEPDFRERFDVATARAVASLEILAEYCLPLVKVGGVFVAMKGPSEDFAPGYRACDILGAENHEDFLYSLPSGDKRRTALIYKSLPTNPRYPRKNVRIQLHPLGVY